MTKIMILNYAYAVADNDAAALTDTGDGDHCDHDGDGDDGDDDGEDGDDDGGNGNDDGEDGDDDDGDKVGGMTGMAVLSQTVCVGGEDNNGSCRSESHIFTHFHSDTFHKPFFHISFAYFPSIQF